MYVCRLNSAISASSTHGPPVHGLIKKGALARPARAVVLTPAPRLPRRSPTARGHGKRRAPPVCPVRRAEITGNDRHRPLARTPGWIDFFLAKRTNVPRLVGNSIAIPRPGRHATAIRWLRSPTGRLSRHGLVRPQPGRRLVESSLPGSQRLTATPLPTLFSSSSPRGVLLECAYRSGKRPASTSGRGDLPVPDSRHGQRHASRGRKKGSLICHQQQDCRREDVVTATPHTSSFCRLVSETRRCKLRH